MSGEINIAGDETLLSGIRACFPSITRNRVKITTEVTHHRGNPFLTQALVHIGSKFPSFNLDALMTLVEARDVEVQDDRIVIPGTFDGHSCEILLVTK